MECASELEIALLVVSAARHTCMPLGLGRHFAKLRAVGKLCGGTAGPAINVRVPRLLEQVSAPMSLSVSNYLCTSALMY